MSQDPPRGSEDGRLHQFEKNRFFEGKLMTARDMAAEQEYHAGRLETMTRYATGRGVLHGLTVSDVTSAENGVEVTVEPGVAVDGRGRPVVVEHTTTTTLPAPSGDQLYLFLDYDESALESVPVPDVASADDGVEVTVEPGVAVDGRGRPVVVEHTTTTTLPAPSGDQLYLFLDYDESALESVPVPDVTGAADDEYAANRTVETFELTAREALPDARGVPDVDTAVDAEHPEALADRYHEQYRTDDPGGDPSVFVGAFERTREGSWRRLEDVAPRHIAYDNEMLYATLVNHLVDTNDPHNTGGLSGPNLDDIDEVTQRLQRLQSELDAVTDRLDTLNRYLMRKSLKTKVRFFEAVADRFEEHDTEGGRIAREIVERARQGMVDEVYDDPEAYREHITETLELDVSLGEALEASATEDSLERYVRAVSELQTALEEGRPVVDIADAQDGVSEAADSLEVLYDIVRDE